MKVVMFADVHLERQFAWADGPAASARRRAIRASMSRVVALAEAERAGAIFCGGDLYENEFFTPDTANFVADVFDCDIPVFISPGNHDFYSPRSMYATNRWSPNVHIFSAPTFTPVALSAGLNVWGAAHVAEKGTENFFDRFAGTDNSEVNLALFHGSESSGFAAQLSGVTDRDHERSHAKVAHAPFAAAQIPRAGFDHAFVGHYHRPVDAAHHCYPGNPDPLEFGESSGRGAVVATIADAGAVTIDRHVVAETLCTSLDVDVTDARSFDDVVDLVRRALRTTAGFVRVDLVGALSPDVDFDRTLLASLQSLGDHLGGFVVRSRVHRAYDLESIRDEQASIRAEFLRQVEASDLPPGDKQHVIELGLRAFDDRRDLEVL